MEKGLRLPQIEITFIWSFYPNPHRLGGKTTDEASGVDGSVGAMAASLDWRSPVTGPDTHRLQRLSLTGDLERDLGFDAVLIEDLLGRATSQLGPIVLF